VSSKLRELSEEFRTVFAGRGNLVDSILPPVIFLIVNAIWGLEYAIWGSLALALLITLVRLGRGQPLRYAFGGLGGVIVAILLARLLDRAEGYFVPNIVTGVLTIIACGASIVAGKPLVAWTSYLTRRWPLDWYWHPRVRPAYTEVTAAWAVFFALRLLLQLFFFQSEQAGALAIINIVTGWPATILLLALSYLYGLWRLQHLRGPSVEEFQAGADPPWSGQRRGF
jgi:hypothetical protein